MTKKNLKTVLDFKKEFRKTIDFVKYIESIGYTLKSNNNHMTFIKKNCTPLIVPNHKDLSMGVCGQLAKIILAEN